VLSAITLLLTEGGLVQLVDFRCGVRILRMVFCVFHVVLSAITLRVTEGGLVQLVDFSVVFTFCDT
jgi:hypothetical protein